MEDDKNKVRNKVKHFAKDFYNSQAWLSCRELALQRDNYLCQDCLSKGLYVPAEEVHHIKHLSPDNLNDPSITLNTDNLVSLCHNCHSSRHGKREKRYKVNEKGEVTCL